MSGISFKKIKIGVVDLKSHNLFSMLQACKNIGFTTDIVEHFKEIKKNDIIILPGVGSFKHAIKYLKNSNLDNELKEFVFRKKKCLFGVCLGMQLLFSSSEEFGYTKGLDLISGKVVRFQNEKKKFKVPHSGWNYIKKSNHNFISKELFKKMYYFTHSYYCIPEDQKIIHSTTNHGGVLFCSSVFKENIIGTQFHPEKSGASGLEILKNLRKII